MFVHVLHKVEVSIAVFLKVFHQCAMFWHLSDVLPIFFLWESHHTEYPVELVMVVWIAGLDILLTTVEDRL